MVLFYLLHVTLAAVSCHSVQLTAYISQSGIHGTVMFQHLASDLSMVEVVTSLQTIHEWSQWSWSIHQLPVHYTTLEGRCRQQNVGNRIHSLDDMVGPLVLPINGTATFTLPMKLVALTGATGIWGHSLLIKAINGTSGMACGTITVSGGADIKVAAAHFLSPVAGTVYFHWLGSQHTTNIDTVIHTSLYWVSAPANARVSTHATVHKWKIYTTDILDSEADKARDNCNFLQLLYDPANALPGHAIGDLDQRLGLVAVAASWDSHISSVYRDHLPADIVSSEIRTHRSVYLVLLDDRHDDSILACARIYLLTPRTLKANINSQGVKGQVTLSQRTPFEPTWLHVNLSFHQTRDEVHAYKIHELPVPAPREVPGSMCQHTGDMYNPKQVSEGDGAGTHETYAVGDLSGKHQPLQLNHKYWDLTLPLQEEYSVAHRSLVLFRKHTDVSTGNVTTMPWLCGNLVLYRSSTTNWKLPMLTAVVVFRYPVVGHIVLRQPQEQPWADTTVIVESLVHGDGTTTNNTADHRWGVHEFPPGQDFYNWSGRCLSAGASYNPYKVPVVLDQYATTCSLRSFAHCRIGDLSQRLGTLTIAGRRVDGLRLSRHIYTDTALPLSGSGTVMGRAMVLFDDNGPRARGERLACSKIMPVHRRKAVAKQWFGNGVAVAVHGTIQFVQNTVYDIMDVDIDVDVEEEEERLYHIHMAPVEANLEYPCEDSTLYGIFNPCNVSSQHSQVPSVGTTDQYAMGDLSGKFGVLEGVRTIRAAYNDTDLWVFGPYSILGRSVIIHSKEKKQRWMCATIERGYSPSEAREQRAIASFHHPQGYAYGYIRMSQLIYNDGSMSDTVIEVNLRHPGKYDRNVTRNHRWAVYVNPVGVDAAVKAQHTRCVAGGYVWNPYYTQLADPRNEELYREECAPDNPLRCYVGDISGRLGAINIGDKRQVFSDINLPLEGPVSAMGRSIVIFNKDNGGERFACANIEPDHDIIKYVNLRKPPKFVLAQFIEDVRQVMGIPEWMLSVDSRNTKVLHQGGCIQFLLHFKGPVANQLEQDFNRLINTGKMASPSLYIPGFVPDSKRKVTLSYRTCGSSDPADKVTGRWNVACGLYIIPHLITASLIVYWWYMYIIY